jgi:hypothetical protein
MSKGDKRVFWEVRVGLEGGAQLCRVFDERPPAVRHLEECRMHEKAKLFRVTATKTGRFRARLRRGPNEDLYDFAVRSESEPWVTR